MRARSRSFYAKRLRLAAFVLLCVWLFISGGVVFAQSSTTGNIFRDFDADGVRDVNEPGIGGVLVTGYDAAGNVYGPVTADIAFATRGNYSLTTPASVTDLRLEFTYPTLTFLRDGAVGADSATSVQFVTAGATGADFAVSDPSQYCDENPLLATSCYRFGDQLTGDNAGSPTVVDFNYDGTGGVNTRAVASEVGAVWGLVHQRSSDDLFAGAFIKRHVGLGPSGNPGTIYRIDRTTNTVSQYVTISAGADPHSPDDDNPPGEPRYFSDIDALNAVGRVGLGDMELSGDETILYVVNLDGNGSLVRINIGSPAVAVPPAGTSIAFPTPPSCTAANTRPGALEWYDGQLYVGLTCTGPTVSDLRAYVYSFNGSSFSAAPVVNLPLNYNRGCVSDNGSECAPAEWQPWITYTSGDVNDVFDEYVPYNQFYKPQPWLLDMEIDAYGFMALSLSDRAGHQLGNNRGLAESGPEEGVAAGDLLRLAPDVNLTSWSTESNGTVGSGIPGGGTGGAGNGEGPGNGEFYSADNFGGTHDEITVGGTALIPSQNEIVASAMDPTTNILSGGVIYLDNSNGGRNGARQLFGTNQPGTFGKAAGIGDIEALCLAAPIQIGNRLWVDSNRNGMQEPGEAPLPGVRVELRTAVGGLIAFAVTAPDGTYYFSSGPGSTSTSSIYNLSALTPATGYQITIPLTDPTNVTALSGYSITTANVSASATAPNASDVNDSDFTPSGSDLIVSFTSGGAGANDHSFDGGFFASDRGDLPDTTLGIGANDYQTLLANGGPTHPIVTGLRLGATVDAEGDGQQSALANGDDILGAPDDEDGVTVADLTLVGGSPANVRVNATNTTGSAATLYGFIDFNGDGDFLDAGETATTAVPDGSSGVEFTLAFGNVPLTSVNATYARFRLSTDAALTANGVATDGEVEDYPVTITIDRDYGDLPDSGPGTGTTNYETTLASGGASHVIVPDLFMGTIVDDETDGQPSAPANGDDIVGDDEDGVTLPTFNVGAPANVPVVVTNNTGSAATLYGFIDFNGDGDFLDAGETATLPVPDGTTGSTITLAFGNVPVGSVAGTYARFRLSNEGGLTANGASTSGEVEDYPVTINPPTDRGDLPDTAVGVGANEYETTVANGGPSHPIITGLRLGATVDGEVDGQPNTAANGDDIALSPDDEDGVTVTDLTLTIGAPANIGVTATNTAGLGDATISGFIDFNGDGDFLDANETASVTVPNGSSNTPFTLNFGTVPAGSVSSTYARFRITTDGIVTANSAATNGEVEDYPVTIAAFDRGDLPDSGAGVGVGNYETLLASGGASHPIVAGLLMGATVDSEPNGQPIATADGDDTVGALDDEDGVTVADLTLVGGSPANVRVNATNTTGSAATLYGFIDFNGDGDFLDAGETATTAVPDGSSGVEFTLAFGNVPAGSVNATYARFRLSTDAALTANGVATDGEVEDYPVTITIDRDYGDLPDSGPGTGTTNYETTILSGGASHVIVPDLFMGTIVDDETDGQPSAPANGDDIVGDDEDGVTLPTFNVGAPANVPVVVTNNTGSAATLYGFIDFNGDGDFLDAGETATLPVPDGTTGSTITLAFGNVPVGSVASTYARFRLSNEGGLTANGASTSGEVEDYPVTINPPTDRGDLPDTAPGVGANEYETTVANGGPSHPIIIGLRLGATVDGEVDGQPNTAANGDDIALSPDDEDGITVADLTLIQGAPANIRVNATNTTGSAATLYGFIDFNGDGDFDDTNETTTLPVPTGSNNVQFTLAFGNVPAGSVSATYARFRLSTDGGLTANNAATDGEVEDYPVAIGAFDRGDLPDTTAGTGVGNYQTLIANSGASHPIVPGLLMGATVDSEPNGQPNTAADGDDANGTPDDEDGVTVADLTLTVGSPANVRVNATNTTGSAATLYGFIDFNGDGDFLDAGETATIAVPDGSSGVEFTLAFGNVPAGSVANSYARFRLSTQAGLTANGSATNGEVEDYPVVIDVTTDRGDLPDSGAGVGVGNYETLIASGGASHTIVAGLRMGAVVDDDADGQPTVGADGDDTNGTPDDEDGVTVADLVLAAGSPANVRVTVTNTTGAAATLYGFIDFNGDGDFLDTNEAITIPVANGTNNATVTLPFGTVPTTSVAATYGRFRLSNQAGLTANGASSSGEVEDYPVTITPQSDRGDLPDTAAGVGVGNYETTVTSGGPSHPIVAGLRMGATVDGEPNGQPNAAATGDDAAGAPDDEDGVTVADLTLTQGAPANIRVTATNTTGTPATLFGFIDFNGDGDFDDAGETTTEPVPTGSTNALITLDFGFVPVGSATSTYARFRLSTDGSLGANGAATDGEVEDYPVTINIPATDRGDLPDPLPGVTTNDYETLIANGGPSHPIITGLRLGATVDGETDGQPTGGANGDDAAGDDEDGVTVADLTLTVGNPASVRVRATNTVAGLGGATITGFIDFNGDGDFLDANETTSVLVPSGSNNVEFTLAFGTVPAGSAATTYARFRITSDGVVGATGAASNGEVEDYVVSISAPVDLGDLPDSALGVGAGNYETLSANGGPSHPIIPGLRIGANEDGEANGQPNVGANGDDILGTPDDEDGVTVADLTLMPGNPANVRVTVTNNNGTDATLYGFIDFNGDGDFDDAGEAVTLIVPSNAAAQNVTLAFGTVPAGSATSTYARFRLSTDTGLTANGAATNGEVEDYPVSIGATGVDRGDLPDTAPGVGAGNYETLGPNNGPTHPIIPTLRMGAAVDGETSGQPNAAANGDDIVGAPDDEDGVNVADLTLTQGAVPNVRVTVTNTSGADARVFGFIDFNGDGDFDDAGETAVATAPNGITSTEVTLTFGAVPAGSVSASYARFRLSTDATLTANGPAINGEVEDYPVIIGAGGVDRGDLPDPQPGVAANDYETLDANGAPSHPIVPGLRIGAAVDGEADGQPNVAASGDDGAGSPDDEDGVTVADLTLTEGGTANVRVRATNTTGTDATLYGFIDFNGDGDFDDTGEAVTVAVPNNSSNVEFTLPFGTVPAGSTASTYARFRLSTDGGLTANGAATDGEVEDYPVTISVGTLSLGNRVWDDTDNSGTLNGAEVGIDNVSIDLYRDTNADGIPDGAPIFSTTTSGGGYYLFDNLPPGTYIVGIPSAEFSGGDLVGYRSSTGPGQETSPESSGDSNDNGLDAPNPAASGILSAPVILSAGGEPINETDNGGGGSGSAANPDSNLTVDFGVFQPPPGTLSLGNRVWIDTDNDGTLNGGEVGRSGVRLTLYDAANPTVPIATTTTDGSGYYLFVGLQPGSYVVGVDASNFATGGALQGSLSSTGAGQEADPESEGDSNDNGIDNPTPTSGGVRSGTVILSLGGEPTGEPDTGSGDGGVGNDNSNLTLDFGFSTPTVTPPTPTPPPNQPPSGTPQPSIFDPGISKAGDPAFAQPGEIVVWTITVTNPNNVPLANVGFTDSVPNTLEVLGATASAGSVTTAGQIVTFNITTLPANAVVTIQVTTRVRSNVVPPFVITNTATLNGGYSGSASATVSSDPLAQINELPATGESPWWRVPLLVVLVMLSVWIGGLVLAERRRE